MKNYTRPSTFRVLDLISENGRGVAAYSVYPISDIKATPYEVDVDGLAYMEASNSFRGTIEIYTDDECFVCTGEHGPEDYLADYGIILKSNS